MSTSRIDPRSRLRLALAFAFAVGGISFGVHAQEPGGPRTPSSAPTRIEAIPGAPPSSASPAPKPARASNAPSRPPIGSGESAAADAPFTPGEVILLWPQDSLIGMPELLKRARLPENAISRQTLAKLGLTMWRLRFESEPRAQEFVQWVRVNWPQIDVDRNWRYEAQASPRLYGLKQVGLDCLDEGSPRLSSIRIGLLDTAVSSIEGLRHTPMVQRAFVDEAMQAPTHHGTSVAAAMTGRLATPRFCGPAAGASLVVAAVMSRSTQGKPHTHTATVLPALDWVLQHSPQLVNLSLGGPGDGLLRRAIARITAMGLPIVAAAGQPGPKASPLYPAAYPGVIAVTALDAADQVLTQAASGDHILLGAPGVDVWLPSVGGGRYETGTSFAAPMVTATLARAIAEGRLKAPDAATWLCRHARDLGPPGRDPTHGCGALRWPPAGAPP
jgi:hypothetical protein